MQNRSELVVRIDFRRYIVSRLGSFLILPVIASGFMWVYYNDLTTVLRTAGFFLLAEPVTLLVSYLFRPAQLRFSGAKLFVTIGRHEQELHNLRQSDVDLRQSASQKAANTCDLHLKDARINAYAHKGGTAVMYGVQDCDAVRKYIGIHFLP